MDQTTQDQETGLSHIYSPAETSLAAENKALTAEIEGLRQQIVTLQQQVDTDTLTPLANRRAFLVRLESEIRQAQRHGTVSTLALLDLNGLKRINDTHGHLAGDAGLCHLAELLIQSFRQTDHISRIGGDEFALILDHAREADIANRLQALTDRLAANPLDWLGTSLVLSLAWGAAEIRGDDCTETVIDRADTALYAAKAAQRSDK